MIKQKVVKRKKQEELRKKNTKRKSNVLLNVRKN